MTVWFGNVCRSWLTAFNEGMGLYGRSGFRF